MKKSITARVLSLVLTVAMIASLCIFVTVPVSAGAEDVIANVDFTTMSTGSTYFVAGPDGTTSGQSPANTRRQIDSTDFYMSSGFGNDSYGSGWQANCTATITNGTGLVLSSTAYDSSTVRWNQMRKVDYMPSGITNLSNDYKFTVEGAISSVLGGADIRFNTSADGKNFYFIRFDGTYNGTEADSKPAWHLYKCVDGAVGDPVLESTQVPYSYNTTCFNSFTLNVTKKGAKISVGVIGYNGSTMVEDGTPLTWEDAAPFDFDANTGYISFLALSNSTNRQFTVKNFKLENIPTASKTVLNYDFTTMSSGTYFIAGADGNGTGQSPANIRKQMYNGANPTDLYYSSGWSKDSYGSGWQVNNYGQLVSGTGLSLIEVSYAPGFASYPSQKRNVAIMPEGITGLNDNYKLSVTGNLTNSNGGADIHFNVSADGSSFYGVRMTCGAGDAGWVFYKVVNGTMTDKLLQSTQCPSATTSAGYLKKFTVNVEKMGDKISVGVKGDDGTERDDGTMQTWTETAPFAFSGEASHIVLSSCAKSGSQGAQYQKLTLTNLSQWDKEPDNIIYAEVPGTIGEGGVMPISDIPVRKIVNYGDTDVTVEGSKDGSKYEVIGTVAAGESLMNGAIESAIKALKFTGGTNVKAYTDLSSYKVTYLVTKIPVVVRLGGVTGATVTTATSSNRPTGYYEPIENVVYAMQNGATELTLSDGTNEAKAALNVNVSQTPSYAIDFTQEPAFGPQKITYSDDPEHPADPVVPAEGWAGIANWGFGTQPTITVNEGGLRMTGTSYSAGAESSLHSILRFTNIPTDVKDNQTIHFVATKGSVNDGIFFRFGNSYNRFYTLCLFAANNKTINGEASTGIFEVGKVDPENGYTSMGKGPDWDGTSYGGSINTDADVTITNAGGVITWSITAGRQSGGGIQTWIGSFKDEAPIGPISYCGFVPVNTNGGMTLKNFEMYTASDADVDGYLYGEYWKVTKNNELVFDGDAVPEVPDGFTDPWADLGATKLYLNSAAFTEVGENAFKDLNDLTDIYINMKKSEWKQNVIVGEGNAIFETAKLHFLPEEYGVAFGSEAGIKDAEAKYDDGNGNTIIRFYWAISYDDSIIDAPEKLGAYIIPWALYDEEGYEPAIVTYTDGALAAIEDGSTFAADLIKAPLTEEISAYPFVNAQFFTDKMITDTVENANIDKVEE